MITNYNKNNRKDDIKLLGIVIAIFLFITWLCTPPGNKFAQMCFWGNNAQYLYARLTKSKAELNAWKFHRNNAVYLARMERKRDSLKEIDTAVNVLPAYASDNECNSLYLDRAYLRLFFGQYKGALDDFLRINSLGFMDKFKVALLLKLNGNFKLAVKYCTDVVNMDSSAYVGYACLADVYKAANRPEVSVRVFDLLIDRAPNRARYYADRAEYKRLCNDMAGYNADIAKAKELAPTLNLQESIIEDTLKPKKLMLEIIS